MAFFVLIVLVFYVKVSESCIDCILNNTNSCLNCSPYYLISSYCSRVCPTYYTSYNNNCSYTGIAPTVFSINFSSYKSLKDTNIGIFNAPTSSFYNSSELEPLPTVDRGFFFSSTSYLYNTHLVPAPDFTLKI